MPSNNESQCYFVQLQIDGYLDGELSETQQGAFVSHVQDCAACANEFHYAQTIHDAVIDLPQIECSDALLEAVERGVAAEPPASEAKGSLWERLAGLFITTPLYFRYGAAAAAVVAIAVLVNSAVLQPAESPEQFLVSESGQQYTSEDITQALDELNVAIDYLNQLSQRTEVMIGDRFLVSPIQDSINASFQRAGISEVDPLQNGPI